MGALGLAHYLIFFFFFFEVSIIKTFKKNKQIKNLLPLYICTILSLSECLQFFRIKNFRPVDVLVLRSNCSCFKEKMILF